MTFDAQFALRRIIEKYSNNTRFCLICNYDNKIIPAIKSRCVEFKFNPINEKIMIEQLEKIALTENLVYEKKSLNVLSNISKGDMRKAINMMQSASILIKDKIVLDTNMCFNISGYPLPEEIEEICNILLDDKVNLENSIKKIHKIVLENGYSISIILKEIVDVLVKKVIIDNILAEKYAFIFSELSNLESKVSKSTFGDIYLSMLISIFKQKN